MTHYDVDYGGMTPQAKHEKAIADIKEYLGITRYVEVCDVLITHGQTSFNVFCLHVSLIGISGYPAQAWYAELWPYG